MEYSLQICNSLHDDHMATVRVLEQLEAQLTKLGRKSAPDINAPDLAKLLTDVAATLKSEITSHFSFEEDNLFTLIEEMGDTPMLMILRDEHNTIRPLAAKITEAISEARADGFSDESWATFYDMGLELVERETFHIQKEEMGFLPLLDQIVDPDDDGELSMAFGELKAAG